MIGAETNICATISQTVVNNNTIVIATNMESFVKSTENLSMKRCDSYKDLPPPVHCSTPKSKTHTKRNSPRNITPTSTWLSELKDCYFPECTTTLQSKSITVDINEKVKRLTSLTSKVIQMLHYQTYQIAKEFDHIYRCLELNCVNFIPALVDGLVNHMIAILLQHSDSSVNLDIYYNSTANLDKLKHSHLPHLIWELNSLALDFSKQIDKLLLHQVEVLVGVLTTVENSTAVMSILNSFTRLGLQCDHLGSLLSRCGGIASLLEIGVNISDPVTSRQALKLLSSVVCAPSAANCFSEVNGFEMLCATLTDERQQLSEKKQVLSVIAQLSDPRYNIRIPVTTLSRIIETVTGLIAQTSCPQSLLSSAVLLVNLSSLKESIPFFIKYSTVVVLLNAIRDQGSDSEILLKEQAASLIASLSDYAEAVPQLCQNRVIPALLCFLNFELSDNVNIADTPSYRLQHKCALALARLCRADDAVSQVEKLQGVPKLLKLCKQGIHEKKNDRRLLACLEALRRILTKSNPKSRLCSSNALQMKTTILNK